MTLCDKATAIIAALVLGLSISLGVFGAGYCLGKSVLLSHLLNRSVDVKGLAERDVKADLGIWQINFREVGGVLNDVNQHQQHDRDVVIAFLKQNGFTDAEIATQPIRLEDRLANAMSNGTQVAPQQRYLITGGVEVRSERVDLIQQVNQLTGSLLEQGVPLAFDVNYGGVNPSYFFTKLDEIRPAMLADATHSARLVAEQFAKDSGTELNGIQHASQGVFEVTGRDASTAEGSGESSLSSINKKVRLVSTLDYRLK